MYTYNVFNIYYNKYFNKTYYNKYFNKTIKVTLNHFLFLNLKMSYFYVITRAQIFKS